MEHITLMSQEQVEMEFVEDIAKGQSNAASYATYSTADAAKPTDATTTAVTAITTDGSTIKNTNGIS